MLDIDKVSALIARAAAEEVMPRFTKLSSGDVREKGPGDLVTVADEAMEQRLAPALAEILSGALVVGEEAAAADPSLLDRLAAAQSAWVIDPIDGTANFAEGRPFFGVMVALLDHGEPVAAWIHDPVARSTATAAKGEGAWLDGHGSGRRLAVSTAPSDPHQLTGTLHSGFFGDRALGQRVQSRRDRVKPIKSLRAAAHEYLRLAKGEVDFTLFTKLMPWDHAPGVLIHREAGGIGRYLDGGEYRAARTQAGGLLMAPDEASWSALRRLLLEEE
jgi:fructose-1,6-bisphosphatase/inositol monophosphatase family enzyme